MNESEIANEFILYLEGKGYFIKNKIENLGDEFVNLIPILEKGWKAEKDTYAEYLGYVVNHFHDKYHVFYLGLPKLQKECPDEMCKQIYLTMRAMKDGLSNS